MRIIFFGTPDFAVPSLKALMDSGNEVCAVVTQPDRLKGRGHQLSQPPVKVFALSLGIPVLQPASVRTASFLSELTALRPEAIVVVAYGRIIPPGILSLPPRGCINVHGSLLPKYRGAAPIQWAIINGEERTGITTMLMDEGLDTGDVLLKDETVILDDDTTESLSRRLSGIGAALLLRTLDGLADGSVRPLPQTGLPSYAPPLKKELGKIDWSRSSSSITSLIRGVYPWPGAYGYLNGERVGIISAKAADETAAGKAGQIIRINSAGMLVATGQGLLSVSEVKPEGRKPMAAAAFARGRHLLEGACFDAL
ncbi:MAG: methionyl-tRNA formyltransferase [Nitrospirae bacterium]|nr:MAG: methionyl-tRNA formyltransferase [Nitrospirota bacterium]